MSGVWGTTQCRSLLRGLWYAVCYLHLAARNGCGRVGAYPSRRNYCFAKIGMIGHFNFQDARFWLFGVYSGNSDANQRCSANASQKAPHIFRAFISTSPSHFNLRLCRSFQSYQKKFRSNTALALGAKHIRCSVSGASLMPSEFDPKKRMCSTKFLEEPRFSICA